MTALTFLISASAALVLVLVLNRDREAPEGAVVGYLLISLLGGLAGLLLSSLWR
ncbi:hypothetical protein KQ693_05780 [Thermus sp. PS18]|uniref:hypothetical protein n=1 Tax=Thermus sp. PS18 TaxID=2849039 RepID=UPI002264D43C|nr:hypothetical protein [Thermus sp. PS18]UZX16539.1 hypothetical protein KQ693_05780 [Thermus sp. PS18]